MEVGPLGDLGQLLESALKNVGLDSSSIRELEPVQIQGTTNIYIKVIAKRLPII